MRCDGVGPDSTSPQPVMARASSLRTAISQRVVGTAWRNSVSQPPRPDPWDPRASRRDASLNGCDRHGHEREAALSCNSSTDTLSRRAVLLLRKSTLQPV